MLVATLRTAIKQGKSNVEDFYLSSCKKKTIGC